MVEYVYPYLYLPFCSIIEPDQHLSSMHVPAVTLRVMRLN